ncbi:peroxiredoxin [Nitrosomonas communis]|uniref:peroxiredoxin n=1 Tax=Nitrosomonas communis TaxID=44574 RepID=UPI0026E93B00|nr:peroxiredoxin [Nitrosomonas communis]MCO6428825.1 peroxiredoxin [Nitrosomonas communis]
MILKPAPDFELKTTGEKIFHLSEQLGKNIVIYFYPKDNTPGCTDESLQFRDLYTEFQNVNCIIVGISRDSIKSHENFKEKLLLPFDLLSDADESVCELYGVIKMKNMYGKQVRGIERSTFAIDTNGIIRKEWRGVKVPNHAEEVLSFIKELKR